LEKQLTKVAGNPVSGISLARQTSRQVRRLRRMSGRRPAVLLGVLQYWLGEDSPESRRSHDN
jgi:hypothetical protein